MPKPKIESQIKEMLVERLMLKINPSQIGDQDDLIEKWGLESVQLMEIVVGLEEVFHIEMEDEEFSITKFKTIQNIAQIVSKKIDPT